MAAQHSHRSSAPSDRVAAAQESADGTQAGGLPQAIESMSAGRG